METDPFTASLILWARMGGYYTLVVFALSIAIAILAFLKRAMVIAYVFVLTTAIMLIFVSQFHRSVSPAMNDALIHVAQIGKTLPYALILWMLLKIENKEDSQQADGGAGVSASPHR